ncbi:MAG TPA: FCD domain-containing protein, partial [Acidimicrobiia bacterium]
HAFRLLFRRMVDESAVANSISEHDQVAAAILAGDARAAERAMREHVRRSGETVLRAGDRHDAF